MPGELTFRPFASFEDYEACTELQEKVWGRGFSEKVSAAILMIANRLGGLAAGAFDEGGTLQGFVFGFTGVMDGKLVHWSDMLAVRSEGRDRGLGTRLKRYQRDVLLERGVREMRWTFDPLQGRNAHVNFSKLGIVCREYVEDMYGETGSPLHRGIGTDRLVAVWDMDSERVESRLAKGAEGPSMEGLSHAPQLLPVLEDGVVPAPGAPILGLDDPRILLAVPGVIDAMMEGDMSMAMRWRKATREAFNHYFSRGYEAREFLRGEGVSFYLLVAADEKPSGAAERTTP
jgi:predicted GNAT superfamily acetyltransferase